MSQTRHGTTANASYTVDVYCGRWTFAMARYEEQNSPITVSARACRFVSVHGAKNLLRGIEFRRTSRNAVCAGGARGIFRSRINATGDAVRKGSWPCDNAPEGVWAGRDRWEALQGDGFEHIFPISVWEATWFIIGPT